MYKEIKSCRVCNSSNIEPILSLGSLAVSDFVDSPEKIPGIVAPLELVLCDEGQGGCGLLQLKHTVSAETMYRNYWYLSGINKTMSDELSQISKSASEVANLESGDFVIDIGANDGTLLRSYESSDLNTIGFEPAKNLFEYGSKDTTKIISDFFNFESWNKLYSQKKAKVITAIGMFYDLDDPNTFVSDLNKCLDDDGLLVIQMMYMPFVLERNAFDGICHEHLEYYTLKSLSYLLMQHDLEIFDVEVREEINEGSVRFYIRKKGKGRLLNISENAESNISNLVELEKKLKLNEINTYDAMVERIEEGKQKTLNFLNQEVKNGKVVHGYAASTKGNTTLQFYEITTDIISAIADRNPSKFGLYTVGSGIPVISEVDSRSQNPDYYFVLAWHFLPDFIQREKDFLRQGGKFIISMPSFTIIDSSILN